MDRIVEQARIVARWADTYRLDALRGALRELDALTALAHAKATEPVPALEAVSTAAQRLDECFPPEGEILHTAIYGDMAEAVTNLRVALAALQAKEE